jgi:hypothetical protein
MAARIPDSLERLSHDDLIGVVRDLVREVTRLGAENEKLVGALGKLRIEHQAVKDELARLKRLPPRPPIEPSGMDKATDAKGPEGGGGEKGGGSTQRRGSQLDKLTIDETIVVKAQAPAGSRHKGYEDIVVQDMSLKPTATRYRRERWETPDGETIVAELASGIVGGYGPNLHRLVLAPRFAGQMTCERIVALLNGMGVVISKRQVVRLLTAKLETFRAEDAAVLKAGLSGAYVTVDDTGARHAGKSGYTTLDRLLRLHDVWRRSHQVAPGVSVAALRRNVALGRTIATQSPCDQRRRARLYEGARPAADRDRQVRRA